MLVPKRITTAEIKVYKTPRLTLLKSFLGAME